MRFRPLLADDAVAVHEVAKAAFDDLARRTGHSPPPPGGDAGAHVRIRHVALTDPGGAWVAEADGAIAGAVLALMREGLWGLSLLVVHPAAQSRGTGRALLELALGYGAGARGQVILSSDDPRALRPTPGPGSRSTPPPAPRASRAASRRPAACAPGSRVTAT